MHVLSAAPPYLQYALVCAEARPPQSVRQSEVQLRVLRLQMVQPQRHQLAGSDGDRICFAGSIVMVIASI